MTKKTSELKKHLEHFQSFEKKFPGKIPFSVHFDFKKHKGHVVFCALVHGNEVGPIRSMLSLIEALAQQKIRYDGQVTFVMANTAAAEKDVRFVESDLNRSFGNAVSIPQSLERTRAQEIATVIESCDVFFDFHQTILPSKHPFYIFPMNPQSMLWAQAACGGLHFVTRKDGVSFSSAGMCSDEFARSLGKSGVTIELGQQGFHDDCDRLTSLILKRTLCNMDQFFLKKRPIQSLAKKNQDFKYLSIVHREPFRHPLKRLNPGFENFHKVHKGMILGVDEFGNPLESQYDGFILFPKYPERHQNQEALPPLPGELFVLLG